MTGVVNVVLQSLEALGTLVAACCALYVIARDWNWRKGAAWKGFESRLDAAERWHESEAARDMNSRINGSDKRLTECEARLDNAATSQDVAKLEGLIARVDSTGTDTKAAVDRIEGMLLEKALNAR